jgi:hypothetical protein
VGTEPLVRESRSCFGSGLTAGGSGPLMFSSFLKEVFPDLHLHHGNCCCPGSPFCCPCCCCNVEEELRWESGVVLVFFPTR